MLSRYGFTNARNNLTEIIDKVQSSFPIIINKRKKSEENTLLLSSELFLKSFKPIISKLINTEIFKEDDGSFTITIEPLGLSSNSKTLEQAKKDIINDVKIYIDEYLENKDLYLNSPNRKEHFPIIIELSLCENDNELMDILKIA